MPLALNQQLLRRLLKPSPHFELALNMIMHVLILFTALTLIFIFIISRTEKTALNEEVNKALTANLEKALDEANASNPNIKTELQKIKLPLEFYYNTVQGEDANTKTYNEGLIRNAYLICAIFFFLLVSMLVTMEYFAGITVGPVFAYVLLGNVLLFILVGGIEYTFFTKIIRQYIPIKPSTITDSMVHSMINVFNPSR